MEKLHWQNTEIAFFLKVTKLFDLFIKKKNFSKMCLFGVTKVCLDHILFAEAARHAFWLQLACLRWGGVWF